jgi:hypothetical protein
MPRNQRSYLVQDPERVEVLRFAWDLLLTGDYTLKQICHELHKRGYTRRSGKPWVKVDPETGQKDHRSGESHLQRTFHMPFYAGWVVSERYGIKRGDIRGHWKPIVTDEEFDRGVEIIRSRNKNGTHIQKHFYLCTGILYMEHSIGSKRRIKMHGTTPTGRSRSYSYYATMQKVEGRKIRVAVEEVDEQIPGLLEGLHVSPAALPQLKNLYRDHIATLQGPTVKERIAELEARIERLKEEEAALARLYARGKLTDKNYDSLYYEWQSKVFETHREISRLESDAKEMINDLDHALFLLTLAPMIFERLEIRSKRRLRSILNKNATP